MKKYMKCKILLLAAVAAFPVLAQANIGDSMQQSVKRYGAPTGHTGNLYYYHTTDWVIQEWFDPGLHTAQAIWYLKYAGDFTRAQTDRIMEVNLPAYLVDESQWTESTEVNSESGRVWISQDASYAFESGYN